MPTLRPYQDRLVGDIRGAFARNRRVLAVSPTGSGKTVVFAYIADGAGAKGNTVTIVAHRAEIVDQIGRALDSLGVRHGRIQPGHTPTSDHVQCAMIQTLARRLDRIPEPSLLVVDECHHATAGSWQTVMSAWSRCKILGVTATPRRLDGAGMCEAFDAMVMGPSVSSLIKAGFLAGFDYLAPPQKVDLSAVKTRMGDFAIDQLAEIMDKRTITGDAVQHYRDHLAGRPAIAFCVTVAHAEHVAAQFAEAGIPAASIDGKMDRAERARLIEALSTGGIQVLTSCELISEGVDVPVVSGAILLRPTKSLGMFLQQVGRCLRPKPGGSRAVILDHVGNVHHHGLPDADREWTLEAKPKKAGAAPTKTCPACFRVFALGETLEPCEGEPDCVFANSAASEKGPPEVVEGTLAPVVPSPEWARGISITAAKGPEFKRLLWLADSYDKLREIAVARGYKATWARFVWDQRKKRARVSEEVPFQPDPAPRPQTDQDVFDEVLAA